MRNLLTFIKNTNYLNPGIFLAIFLIFTFRNLDPILFPTIYADDGGWIGLIMQKGLVFAAFNAREGFPVLGLVILDWIALQMDIYLSQGNIFHLPYHIWFVSTLFLSLVSFLPIIIFKDIVPFGSRLIMAFALALMPTGSSGNEIFGRICNLGYLFPLISTYVLCKYYISEKDIKLFLASVFTLFISSLTFPVCFGMLGIWLAFEVWGIHMLPRDKVLSHQGLKISILIGVLMLSLYLMPSNLLTFKGGAAMPIKSSGWIDYIGIRLLIYPLVSSIYAYLNDFWTIFLFIVFSVFSFAPLNFSITNSRLRASSVIALCSLIIYIASTAIMRGGFTSLFGDYRNSYPDRYFYGINTLFIISLFLTANLYPRGSRRTFSAILAGWFMINCLISYKSIFELNRPASEWRNFGDLKKMVCSSNQGEKANSLIIDGALTTISIYPVISEGCCWTMTLPSDVVLKSMAKECVEK